MTNFRIKLASESYLTIEDINGNMVAQVDILDNDKIEENVKSHKDVKNSTVEFSNKTYQIPRDSSGFTKAVLVEKGKIKNK